MASNCLISFFTCGNYRKRTILPLENSIYTNPLPNLSEHDSRNINHSDSLPSLRSSLNSSFRPSIMIRNGTTFQEQFGLIKSKAKNKPNSSLSPAKDLITEIHSDPFILRQKNGLPKLLPITPRTRSLKPHENPDKPN